MIKKSPQTYNTRFIYNTFVDKNKNIKINNKEQIDKLTKTYQHNLKMLDKFSLFIDKFTSTTLEKIVSYKSVRPVNLIRFKFVPINKQGVTKDHLMLWISSLVKANIELNKLKSEIEEIPDKIPYMEFRFIINQFNELIIDEMIKTGYKLKLGGSLGEIYILRKKRKSSPIDWNASNKLREQLIKEGVEVFDKVNNPNGRKWFIHFDSFFAYYWYWKKPPTAYLNENLKLFSFNPVRGTNSIVTKLHSYIRNNPNVVTKYEMQKIK